MHRRREEHRWIQDPRRYNAARFTLLQSKSITSSAAPSSYLEQKISGGLIFNNTSRNWQEPQENSVLQRENFLFAESNTGLSSPDTQKQRPEAQQGKQLVRQTLLTAKGLGSPACAEMPTQLGCECTDPTTPLSHQGKPDFHFHSSIYPSGSPCVSQETRRTKKTKATQGLSPRSSLRPWVQPIWIDCLLKYSLVRTQSFLTS